MRFRTLLFIALFAGTSVAQLQAQAPPADVTIRIRIADTARVAVVGADISIVRGLNEIIGRGTTDNEGRATILVARDPGDLQVSVRKVGYQPANLFFVLAKAQVTPVELTLRRAVQTLAPVTVTAAEDAKRKSYHVDADLIANSPRPLFDAMDIVTKMIPDVIEGRAGPESECGVKDVWVNGSRILFPPSNDMVMSRVGRPSPVPTPGLVMNSGGASGRPLPTPLFARADSSVWLTLATIKPEHIEEMTYEDCFSTVVTDHTHANRALFVVLKPGVGYDMKRGSYVISDENSKNKPRTQPAISPVVPAMPTYRARLVGVFDAGSGIPIENATVTDSASGTHAETTVTGTITLAFLPEGPSVLRISKPGYPDARVEVLISPQNTFPLTVVMTKPPS